MATLESPYQSPWSGWQAAPQGIDPGLWGAIQGLMGSMPSNPDGSWSWGKGLGFIPSEFMGSGGSSYNLNLTPEQFLRAGAGGAFSGTGWTGNTIGIANPQVLAQMGIDVSGLRRPR